MRHSRFRSISAILTVIVMLAVFPVLAILTYSGFEHRKNSIAAAKRDLLLVTHSMAQVLTGITRSAEQILSTLSLSTAVQALDVDACTALFKALTEEHPLYLGLTLVDTAGNVLASNRPFERINLADRKHFRDALEEKRFATGEYITTRVGKKQSTFSFACPVMDRAGNAKAVLTAVLQLDRITGFFNLSKMPPGAFIAITDHRGIRLLYHPARSTNPVGKPVSRQNWELARNAIQPGIFIRQGSDGIRRIFAFEPLRHPDGTGYLFAWAGTPESKVLAPANTELTRNLLLMAVVAGLALAVSWMIGRSALISPIQELVATTRRFTCGDLDARCRRLRRSTELDALAQAFDDMADSLAASQREIKRREAHLEEAQRIGHIGSWELDTATGRIFLSREMYRILERPQDDAGLPVSMLASIFTPESMRTINASMERVLDNGKPYEGDLEFRTSAGQHRWIHLRGEVRQSEAGIATGLRGTALDITRRIAAERDRQTLQNQLVQAQKMESVGRLAGGVAHDFNNMLSIIIGHTELAMEDLDRSDPLYAGFAEIRKAADRSANLVRQLLAFARKQNVCPQVLDLNDTVGDMLTMLQRLIGEDITLSFLPGKSLWPVKMDPGQVDQILANLCVNARDAIDGVGCVTISTRNVSPGNADGRVGKPLVNDYVELTVSDDGCGMDRATRKHIFEPFFTTKELGKGTGLGLSTVFGIVKQNGGDVAVTSETGCGATIRITFPRHDGAADSVPHKAAVTVGSGRETVLLIEDEPVLLQMTCTMLERSGYQVLTSTTPSGAIDLARDHNGGIQLLLTDVIMPEMNGLELSRKIESICPGIKTLFMSGYTANVIARQGILEKDVNFIQKPFTRSDLAAIIQTILRPMD